MPLTIEVFSDIWCPFAYVGIRRFIEARDNRGSTTVLSMRAWPLEVVNGRPLSAATVFDEAQSLREQVAIELFSGLRPDRFPSTTLPALGLAAMANGVSPALGEQVGIQLRRALFEQGADISDPSVLEEIAAEHGLSLPDPAWGRAQIEADYREGHDRGVRGSPHFFVQADDYFCPTLHLEHEGSFLRVGMDDAGFASFLERSL